MCHKPIVGSFWLKIVRAICVFLAISRSRLWERVSVKKSEEKIGYLLFSPEKVDCPKKPYL
jgi:hypothetical protein